MGAGPLRGRRLASFAPFCVLVSTALAGCTLPGAHSSTAQSSTTVSPGTPQAATSTTSGTTSSVHDASASPTPTPSPSVPWPAGGTITVLGLGDSVMSSEGCGCSGPVAEFSALLQAKEKVPVTSSNQGESGLTAAGLSARIDGSPELQAAIGKADVVLLTIGANDVAPLSLRWESCDAGCWGPTVAQMGKDLGAILDDIARMRAGHPTQVLVTNYWNVLEDGTSAVESQGSDEVSWNRELTSASNVEIATVVQAHGDHLVDLVKPFMGPSGSGDPTDKLLSDGDHPNASGVSLMAQAFLAATS